MHTPTTNVPENIWIVCEAAFEYNDETTYPTEGSYPREIFRSYEEAEARAKQFNNSCYANCQLGDWAYDIDNITSEDELGLKLGLAEIFDLEEDYFIDDDWSSITLPSEVTDDQARQLDNLLDHMPIWYVVNHIPTPPWLRSLLEREQCSKV
jgi:hypothetical protein